MYEFEIRGMAREVVKEINASLGLALTISDEALLPIIIRGLETHWQDKIALTWCTKDVTGYAEQIGVSLTEQEARDILHDLLRRHDASEGVNWSVMDSAIAMRNW